MTTIENSALGRPALYGVRLPKWRSGAPICQGPFSRNSLRKPGCYSQPPEPTKPAQYHGWVLLPAARRVEQHLARRGPHGVGSGCVLAEALGVELVHESASNVVVHRPQRHHHAARSGHAKGALQSQHALAVAHLSVAGVAGRKHSPIHAVKVKRGDLLGSEDGGLAAAVGAGEDQARVE